MAIKLLGVMCSHVIYTLRYIVIARLMFTVLTFANSSIAIMPTVHGADFSESPALIDQFGGGNLV